MATVMLGIDTSTPFQGLTDNRGQLTFSDPSLVKAQLVTVYKDGYESTTVTAVNAENLTVFIARTGGGGGLLRAACRLRVCRRQSFRAASLASKRRAHW